MVLDINVLQGGVFSTSPNHQAGELPLVGCPRLLIQFIRNYPPYRRPFLYPQPEDAPCRGDRDQPHGHYLLDHLIKTTCFFPASVTTFKLRQVNPLNRGTLRHWARESFWIILFIIQRDKQFLPASSQFLFLFSLNSLHPALRHPTSLCNLSKFHFDICLSKFLAEPRSVDGNRCSVLVHNLCCYLLTGALGQPIVPIFMGQSVVALRDPWRCPETSVKNYHHTLLNNP